MNEIIPNTINFNTFVYLSSLFCWLWLNLDVSPIVRSSLHSLIAIILSKLNVTPLALTATISCGYYVADLYITNKLLYIFHHIFAIYTCWYTLAHPYNTYNILHEAMIIEGSVPFLNYYLLIDKQQTVHKTIALSIYLLTHIYFRNYLLYKMYKDLVPTLIDNGASKLNVKLFQIFIIMNIWWTCTTIQKLSSLLKQLYNQ